MSLQKTLDRMKQEFADGADPEILATMKNATGNLLQSGILDNILKSGTTAPDFTLEDAGGHVFNSRELLTKGPLLLTFYRGIW